MKKSLLENSMQRLQNGDIEALNDVYMLTSKTVYCLSYYILKNTERAKDIMHDTYINILSNIQKYKLNTNALAWVTTIARNLSFNEYKKLQRNVSLEIFEDTLQDNLDYPVFVENNVYLKDALDILNEKEREIVILYAVDCFKHREIAQIVNRPKGTVQWIYHYAIKKIREKTKNENKETSMKFEKIKEGVK